MLDCFFSSFFFSSSSFFFLLLLLFLFILLSPVPVDFRRYVVEQYCARISFFLRRAKRAARKARKVKSKIVTVFDLEDHHQDPFPNYRYCTSSIKFYDLRSKIYKHVNFFGDSSDRI
jgi:hypothetical protein